MRPIGTLYVVQNSYLHRRESAIKRVLRPAPLRPTQVHVDVPEYVAVLALVRDIAKDYGAILPYIDVGCVT